MKIVLGKEYKDAVSGFQGIAVAKSEYLTGCDRVGLQPQAKEDKVPETLWFDVQCLVPVENGIDVSHICKPAQSTEKPGAYGGNPKPRANTPARVR